MTADERAEMLRKVRRKNKESEDRPKSPVVCHLSLVGEAS